MNVLDSTWLGTESCLDSFPFFNCELANASSVRLLPTQQLLLASVPLRCLPVIWCLLDTFCPWTGLLVWSWFMSGEHSAKQLRLTPFSLSSQLFQPHSSAHPFFLLCCLSLWEILITVSLPYVIYEPSDTKFRTQIVPQALLKPRHGPGEQASRDNLQDIGLSLQ